MNFDEKIANEYLPYLAFTDVVFEPHGKTRPDFLIDGQIAVEVRRLNPSRTPRVHCPFHPRNPSRGMLMGQVDVNRNFHFYA